MKLVFLLFIFFLPFNVMAERCGDIDENSYKNESRISPDGGIYVITGKGRAYFYSAPNIACRKNIFILPGDQIQAYTELNGYISVMYFKKYGGTEEGWILKI